MSELSQESLLREIDEDLRRDRFMKLWKRYGVVVVALAVCLVLGVAGYQIWQGRQLQQRETASAAFLAAARQAETDRAGAERALETLADEAPAGYAMVAEFQRAALLAQGNDRQAARDVYRALQKSAPEALYRDLATLQEVQLVLSAEATPIDADALRKALQPLLADDNPWRFSARETAAMLALRSGELVDARSLLSSLAADAQAPADLRSRAGQLLTQVPAQ